MRKQKRGTLVVHRRIVIDPFWDGQRYSKENHFQHTIDGTSLAIYMRDAYIL